MHISRFSLWIMRYALCKNAPANQLGFAKILWIIRNVHYHVMHYEKLHHRPVSLNADILQVFPDAVINKNHDPNFNLENRGNWITEQALAWFSVHLSDPTRLIGGTAPGDPQWKIAEAEVREQCRTFIRSIKLLLLHMYLLNRVGGLWLYQILPAQTASHAFFGIDNTEDQWCCVLFIPALLDYEKVNVRRRLS